VSVGDAVLNKGTVFERACVSIRVPVAVVIFVLQTSRRFT